MSPGPHQRRRDDRDEPRLDGLRDREVDQGELEQRTDPGEEREPGAAHLGTALGVDGAEQGADVEVVTDREGVRRDLPDLLEHDEVRPAAGRC